MNIKRRAEINRNASRAARLSRHTRGDCKRKHLVYGVLRVFPSVARMERWKTEILRRVGN